MPLPTSRRPTTFSTWLTTKPRAYSHGGRSGVVSARIVEPNRPVTNFNSPMIPDLTSIADRPVAP